MVHVKLSYRGTAWTVARALSVLRLCGDTGSILKVQQIQHSKHSTQYIQQVYLNDWHQHNKLLPGLQTLSLCLSPNPLLLICLISRSRLGINLFWLKRAFIDQDYLSSSVSTVTGTFRLGQYCLYKICTMYTKCIVSFWTHSDDAWSIVTDHRCVCVSNEHQMLKVLFS